MGLFDFSTDTATQTQVLTCPIKGCDIRFAVAQGIQVDFAHIDAQLNRHLQTHGMVQATYMLREVANAKDQGWRDGIKHAREMCVNAADYYLSEMADKGQRFSITELLKRIRGAG